MPNAIFYILVFTLQIQHLQESNRTITLDVSTLVHTCDKLSDELHASQEDLDFWEKQYAAKSGEVGVSLEYHKHLPHDQVNELFLNKTPSKSYYITGYSPLAELVWGFPDVDYSIPRMHVDIFVQEHYMAKTNLHKCIT